MSEEESQQIAREVEERLQGYATALKQQDLDWFLNFWADEEDFVMALDGEIADAYDIAVTNNYKNFFDDLDEVLHIGFSDGMAHVIDRSTATYVTRFDWGIVTESGDTVQSRGSGLYLFERLDGGWKALQVAGTHQYY